MNITYTALHTWAQQQPDDKPIGMANDCAGCPVVQFLVQTTGLLDWEVTPVPYDDGIFAVHLDSGTRFALPDWLDAVIRDVDRGLINIDTPVSKQAFLAILAKHRPCAICGSTQGVDDAMLTDASGGKTPVPCCEDCFLTGKIFDYRPEVSDATH